MDTGAQKTLSRGSAFVEIVQERQGYYISCIEEIAWRRGFIDDEQLHKLGKEQEQTAYGQYILSLLEEKGTKSL